MRARATFAIFILSSCLAAGQSMSPDALYDRALNALSGEGISRNDHAAIDNFRRSADLGYGPAQVAMGYYYEMGTVAGDPAASSLELYKKAAVRGDSLAAWLAGRRYFLGNNGVAKDPEAAKKWLKMAADQNSAYGSYYLGRLVADRDPAKALALFKVGANEGLPQAQYFYGKALKNGQGTAPDKFDAFVWLSIAADGGYDAANTELADLRSSGAISLDDANQAAAKARDLEQVVIRAVTARGCSGWDGEFAEFPTPPPPSLQRYCH